MDAKCPVEETKLPFCHSAVQLSCGMVTDIKQIMTVQNYPETQAG